MLRPYSIQDSTHDKIGWLRFSLVERCGFQKICGGGACPARAGTHTNAEIPVIFSPMISLWMSFVPS
jgi:hypothetical protein